MIDILLDSTTGDLLLNGGDIAYGESTLQHQRDILIARAGDYRYAPTVGVGVKDYVNDDDAETLLRSITQQFTADGMRVNRVAFANKKISIDASY